MGLTDAFENDSTACVGCNPPTNPKVEPRSFFRNQFADPYSLTGDHALMEACVRHLRVPKEIPAARASFLLIQDTLQTLGQQAICWEVTILLLLHQELLVLLDDNLHSAGDISVAAVCCAE